MQNHYNTIDELVKIAIFSCSMLKANTRRVQLGSSYFMVYQAAFDVQLVFHVRFQSRLLNALPEEYPVLTSLHTVS